MTGVRSPPCNSRLGVMREGVAPTLAIPVRRIAIADVVPVRPSRPGMSSRRSSTAATLFVDGASVTFSEPS